MTAENGAQPFQQLEWSRPKGYTRGVATTVTDNKDLHRFEIRLDGELAGFTDYHQNGDVMVLIHTEVDERFQGHGLASRARSVRARRRARSGLRGAPAVPAGAPVHPGPRRIPGPRAGKGSSRVRPLSIVDTVTSMPVAFEGPESELAGLSMFLDEQRAAVLRKLDGVSDAEAVCTPTVSSLSLLTIVKHLAYCERRWFQLVVAGRDHPGLWPPDDPQEELRVDPGDTVESVLRAVRRHRRGVTRAITATVTSGDQPGVPSGCPG